MMTCYNVPALSRNRNCEFLWTFHQSTTRKWIWKCRLHNSAHFVWASISKPVFIWPSFSGLRTKFTVTILKVHFCRVTRCFLGHGGMPIDIQDLTHWGRVTYICVSDLILIGSDNGLSPGRRQAIIWTNAGILLIGLLGTNFSEILIEICIF